MQALLNKTLYKKIIQRVTLLGLLILSPCLLYADNLTIPTITVSTKKSQSKPINKGSNQINVNQRKLKQGGAISLTDFMRQQGLVRLKNSSALNNQTSIDIHGFGVNAARNTLILIDGIPFTSFNVVGPNLNALLLDNIDNVSIMPGSFGSLYGNQAIGGVVKIVTHRPDKKKLAANVAVGNKKQASVSGFSSQRFTNGVGYNLGALGYHTDNFQQHNLQNNYNLNAKTDYQGRNGYIAANFIGYSNDIQMPQAFILNQAPPSMTQNKNYVSTEGAFSYLLGKLFINDYWENTTTLSSSNSKSHGVVNIPFTNNQDSVRLQNQVKGFIHQTQVIVGGNIQQDRYALNNSKQNKRVQDLISTIYGQTTFPVHQHWFLTLGGRAANQAVKAWPNQVTPISDSNQIFVSEQTLGFKPNQQFRIYVRRDGNYRFAKADEKIWIKDNIHNLQTQRGTSYETGFAWQQHGQQLKLSIYHLNLTNEIAYDPNYTPEAPFGYMKNLPPTQRNGVDFYYAAPVASTVDVNTQLSYVDPRFRSGMYKGKQIPAVSPLKASASVNFHPQPSWLFTVEETYSSRYFASDDLANIGGKLPAYCLTSVYIKKSWQTIAMSLRLNNVFNKHYPRYTDFISNNTGQGGDIYYYPADGLSVLVSLHFNCDNV